MDSLNFKIKFLIVLLILGLLIFFNSCIYRTVKHTGISNLLENRKWKISSIKYHNNIELKPNLKFIETCDTFEIKHIGKEYYYQIDDCCNKHEGTLLLENARIIVQSKQSTLLGCFPDFKEEQKKSVDCLAEQGKYTTLKREWNNFFAIAETLHTVQIGNELKIWNDKNDTSILVLNGNDKKFLRSTPTKRKIGLAGYRQTIKKLRCARKAWLDKRQVALR